MQAMIDELAKQAAESLGQVSGKETLASFWQEYLSKNGKIPALMKNLRTVAPEERPAMGKIINELKAKVQADYDAAAEQVKQAELAARNAAETVDITLPAKTRPMGGLHPLTLITNQIIDVFSGMGFSVGTFPEQEGTMGLLIRAEHPALKDYPTGTASNWQWWTQSHGRAFRLPRTIEPVVRVLDSVTRLDNLGLLWEARLGKGRLLVSGMDLAGHLEFPECRYLLECLAAYLDGPAAPMAAVTPEELRRLIRVSPR